MDKVHITDQLRNCRLYSKFELEQICHEALHYIQVLETKVNPETRKFDSEMNAKIKEIGDEILELSKQIHE